MNGNEFLRRLKAISKARGLTLVVDSRQGKGSHQTILFGDKRTTIRHLPDELKTGTLKEPLQNLLRSSCCAPAVLGILIYIQVNCGSCAPATRDLPSLATVLQRFLNAMCKQLGIRKEEL